MSESLSLTAPAVRSRPRAIHAAATGVAGFLGVCGTGPVHGPALLVTSFEDFRRVFGGLSPLVVGGVEVPCYLAHAVQSFFENGGKRLFVARVFRPRGRDPLSGFARSEPVLEAGPRFVARFPGAAGNMPVRVRASRGTSALVEGKIVGLRSGDVVEISPALQPRDVAPSGAGGLGRLAVVTFDSAGRPGLSDAAGAPVVPAPGEVVQRVTFTLEIGHRAGHVETVAGLSTSPLSPSFIGNVLRPDIPRDLAPHPFRPAPSGEPPPALPRVSFALDGGAHAGLPPGRFAELARALLEQGPFQLRGGDDGDPPLALDYRGAGAGERATGLCAFDAADVPILAAPGSSCLGTAAARRDVRAELALHADRAPFRMVLLAAGASEPFPESIAADLPGPGAVLLHPHITVFDPFSITGETLRLPPEGPVAGLLCSGDSGRASMPDLSSGEVLSDALGVETNLDPARREALESAGVTCLSLSPSGAVSLSSERRAAIAVQQLAFHLAASIQRGTRWVLFEPNDEALWRRIQASVEAFLHRAFQRGLLAGAVPSEAYRVRCDRTTLSAAGLAAGKLAIAVEIAPVEPGRFTALRIEQWTGSAGR